MTEHILTTRVSAADIVVLRSRTRQVGELFGLDVIQLTRFITAVSEIARNTIQYAGEGSATFQFDGGAGHDRPQRLLVLMADKGRGIANLQAVLDGAPDAKGKVPMGIAGSRRLVDELRVECPAGGGTLVTIAMVLPRQVARHTPAEIASRVKQLDRRRPKTPVEEMEQQNREMLFTQNELRLKQLELQLADERKNQFLSTLAHELRNPLGTLQMTLLLLTRKTGLGPAELSQRYGIMARQVTQITRLVDDLMDVSRVTHGKVELDMQPAEVNALVTQAVEMSGAAIQARQQAVVVRLNKDELWIRGDDTRLKQVLCNLIQNATRYTPEKGNITVSVRRESTNAVIEVADDGIGIAPEVLPTVFELFVQGGLASGANQGGLGVGLTLVQRLTRDHGGTVAAASEGLGKGSRFTVTLPLSSAPVARPNIAVLAPQAPAPAPDSRSESAASPHQPGASS
ncbi:MAG: sensor histidine kinase [Burkholderiales bacterium]|nr:sensor histidine kinase [Burkholderiales bacterium]